MEIWGEFLLEAIDPYHRRLMTFFDVWQHYNPRKSIPNFFLWLEDKNVPRFLPSIVLIDKDKLSEYEIFVKNNVFYDKKGELLHNEADEDEYIYIIDHNLKILACVASEKIRHTSLSHYKVIIGAGTFKIKNGMLVELSFDSGHYIPQIEHFRQTINVLESKFIVLNDQLKLIYYKNFEKIVSTVGAFKKKYM